LDVKLGSKATPSMPRSPLELTVTVTNGVESNTPFLMTLRVPPCSHTKMRPSGASAIAVGFVNPPVTIESVNPLGTVAALAKLSSAAITAMVTACAKAIAVAQAFRVGGSWGMGVRVGNPLYVQY